VLTAFLCFARNGFNEAATHGSRNSRTIEWVLSTIRCFNEAATHGSRNWAGADSAHGRGMASMRPRPMGRGIGLERISLVVAILASMRPRPMGRGIDCQSRSYRLRQSSFNEAATHGSRNLERSLTGAGYLPGFNEAATHGSRNCLPEHLITKQGLASMRPRPMGRGIVGCCKGGEGYWNTLQ